MIPQLISRRKGLAHDTRDLRVLFAGLAIIVVVFILVEGLVVRGLDGGVDALATRGASDTIVGWGP